MAIQGRGFHGQVNQQVSQNCARGLWGRVLSFRAVPEINLCGVDGKKFSGG